MMDSYLTEYNYLKAFKANTGVKQDLNLSGQILASLARVLQIHQLQNSTYNYLYENEQYYRENNEDRDTINYTKYRINTFMNDYLELQ